MYFQAYPERTRKVQWSVEIKSGGCVFDCRLMDWESVPSCVVRRVSMQLRACVCVRVCG